jgi:hypothetical protein
MKNLMVFCIAFTILTTGCEKFSKKDISGNWQAASLMEEGQPMKVNVDAIYFNFDENGGYEYSGTLKYKEKGSYYLQGDLLYTTDTLNESSVEKAVRITKLTPDSLFLKMNASGKEQFLHLYKK